MILWILLPGDARNVAIFILPDGQDKIISSIFPSFPLFFCNLCPQFLQGTGYNLGGTQIYSVCTCTTTEFEKKKKKGLSLQTPKTSNWVTSFLLFQGKRILKKLENCLNAKGQEGRQCAGCCEVLHCLFNHSLLCVETNCEVPFCTWFKRR